MRVRILKGTSKDARASIWYTVSNLISRASGFIFTPIFTRILTPEEYGVYPMYLSVMGIFTVITTLELSGNTVYKGIDKFGEDFTSSVFGLECILFVFAFISYALLGKIVNSLTGLGFLLTTSLLIQVFFTAIEGLYFAKKRYNGDYMPVTCINALTGVSTPITALVFIKLGGGGEARIAAPLIVSAVASLTIIPRLYKKVSFISFDKWKYALKLSIPMLPHYLAATLIAQGDKLIVGRVIGKEALGRYSAAFSAGFAPSVLTSGIALALTPWIMRKLKNERLDRIKEAEGAIIAIIGFFITAYLTVLPEAFAFFAPREYSSALPVCYFTAVSVLFSLLSSISAAVLLFYEKSLMITRNSLIAAAVAIVSEYALAKRAGIIGAAVGAFVPHLILFILASASVKKISEKRLVNAKNDLPLLAFITIFAIFSFVIRGSFLARILLLSASATIFIPKILRAKKTML